MKVLIIDRDTMYSNLMAGKIRSAGHEVVEASLKNDGIEQIGTNTIDAVYFDPSPMIDPKSIVFQIRRMVHTFPYMVLMGPEVTIQAAVVAGCHACLPKPLDSDALGVSLENAGRMFNLIRRIGDESYDFPSAGGVISKSAFNQLFISAIDRVGRYGENAHVLFISIANYEDIKLDDGQYAADYAVSKLAQMLVRSRRQSDILAQTGVSEFALLLQRPSTPTESVDAARRFASILDEQQDITSNGVTELRLEVSLVQLPNGARGFHHATRIKGQGSRQAG